MRLTTWSAAIVLTTTAPRAEPTGNIHATPQPAMHPAGAPASEPVSVIAERRLALTGLTSHRQTDTSSEWLFRASGTLNLNSRVDLGLTLPLRLRNSAAGEFVGTPSLRNKTVLVAPEYLTGFALALLSTWTPPQHWFSKSTLQSTPTMRLLLATEYRLVLLTARVGAGYGTDADRQHVSAVVPLTASVALHPAFFGLPSLRHLSLLAHTRGEPEPHFDSPGRWYSGLTLAFESAHVVVTGGAELPVSRKDSSATTLFMGLTWIPHAADRDGDGIVDRDDVCPEEPEDRDQDRDTDGCPEDPASSNFGAPW